MKPALELDGIDSEQVWSSQSGMTTETRHRVSFEVIGEPTEKEMKRAAVDALTYGTPKHIEVEPVVERYGLRFVTVVVTMLEEW